MKFASIDPSLNNTAIVVGEIFYHVDSMKVAEITVTDSVLIKTEKSRNKKIRASSDMITRCRALFRGVKDFLKEHDPMVIFIETPSGSQSAGGARTYGIVCMLIAGLSPAPIEVTPMEVKVAVTNDKVASKEKMIGWAVETYPHLDWLYFKGKLSPQNEHMADACGIVHAGAKTEQFQRLLESAKHFLNTRYFLQKGRLSHS